MIAPVPETTQANDNRHGPNEDHRKHESRLLQIRGVGGQQVAKTTHANDGDDAPGTLLPVQHVYHFVAFS